MTDRIALILFLLIAGAVAADLILGFGASIFLARKALDFLHWVIFWR